MKVLRAAALMALLLAGPAYAAGPAPPAPPQDQPKSATQIENEKSADRAYRNSLRNIPDQPAADPWGGARAVETKPAATASAPPPAKRTKTSTGTNN